MGEIVGAGAGAEIIDKMEPELDRSSQPLGSRPPPGGQH
jgi:hypothetical protein